MAQRCGTQRNPFENNQAKRNAIETLDVALLDFIGGVSIVTDNRSKMSSYSSENEGMPKGTKTMRTRLQGSAILKNVPILDRLLESL